MGKMSTCLPVVSNMLAFILLYYFFSFFIFFSIFFFKMRKVFYSLLVSIYIWLYMYSPAYALYLKEIELGNYYICNLNDYPSEHCVVDYDPNKRIKFLCPIVHNEGEHMNTYNSSYCFTYEGIKDRLIIRNNEEPIYTTLPGIILENQILYDRYNLGIYIMPFKLEADMSIVCVCDTKKEYKGITPYIKINIKNSNNVLGVGSSDEYIKGCDFGNNKGKHQFLTSPQSHEHRSVCAILANPGDIVGINCINYNEDDPQNNDVTLEPSNCFSTVSFSLYTFSFVKMNINNILPDAKYYPETSAFPKDPNFKKFSTTSYLWIPANVPQAFFLVCSCKYAKGEGTAMYHVSSSTLEV
ncbi:6-cysteine protein [Plasmodium knowlesi strain H]|uniref:6-cysteine protein n=3 Tax=Plasmodium knowlesi TaxID=5850 RepID=A0A5K1TXP0_PLAKH|nr:pbs36-like protein [Plasmodium knowlesi strain H]OTN68606.1 6-cysteine protein [Plasmodium knowlesi]CAA9986452.1 6-cysteine protein P36, putative [Plasmodium knowlesi strain H]SBO24299.1 6-cysteine protein [Plasmodium knowlesi strain H]SBO29700.1 6-cysteine protein [Plasmodium knowlesi strain H]VVS75926.1 6-cysteine protein P36, putative [Plasmodium knowlesi strain H]|eukprot:XP_002261003.1 pbs36-like protein [Plasmodium knowlesi strain H]